ncbi:MAG TPA: maleylpyruvate isomerase family mycothiol-dependent enzyme [Acidimicrobiales bacterium]|nr:maleylpyruvate isomerase family mycothiol-dependent enzyme [Acidimicrobiales bacterium]
MEQTPQAEHIGLLFDPRSTLDELAGQRRRFAAAVEGLSEEELAAPSRCAEWTVADVLRHLVWVDRTMRRIWAGERAIPKDFDARITPNDAVRDERAVSDKEIRERYLTSTTAMAAELEGADPERFGLPSRSPAGPVPWWMSAVHIGWDSAVHERDVLLPLGLTSQPSSAEVEVCLAYSLVLTSFFAGADPLSVRVGTVALSRDDGPVVVRPATGEQTSRSPEAAIAVPDPVAAIDALSGRGPVEESMAGDAAVIHRLGGLARYFTTVPG